MEFQIYLLSLFCNKNTMNKPRHVRVEHSLNDALKENQLEMLDLLVYASIKKYMNNTTRISDSTHSQIMSFSGLSKPTVIKCIKNLSKMGFIEIFPRNMKSNNYKFPMSAEHFEQFLFEFLDNDKLKPQDKAFIIACRKFFLNNENGEGFYIAAGIPELSRWTGMIKQTVSNRIDSLKEKGMVKYELKTRPNGNSEVGLLFDVESLGLVLHKQAEEIETLKENKADNSRVDKLEKEVEALKKLLIVK